MICALLIFGTPELDFNPAERSPWFDATFEPVVDIVERIEAVDREAIGRVAGRLTASPPTFAALGPIGRVKAMGAIEERFA